MWSSQWNENWQGKQKYTENPCPSATAETFFYLLLYNIWSRDKSDYKQISNRISWTL
jgi:hypothetical protein